MPPPPLLCTLCTHPSVTMALEKFQDGLTYRVSIERYDMSRGVSSYIQCPHVIALVSAGFHVLGKMSVSFELGAALVEDCCVTVLT